MGLVKEKRSRNRDDVVVDGEHVKKQKQHKVITNKPLTSTKKGSRSKKGSERDSRIHQKVEFDSSDSEEDSELWLIKIPSHLSALALSESLSLPVSMPDNFSKTIEFPIAGSHRVAFETPGIGRNCSDKELEYLQCLMPVVSSTGGTTYKLSQKKFTKLVTVSPNLSLPCEKVLESKAAERKSAAAIN